MLSTSAWKAFSKETLHFEAQKFLEIEGYFRMKLVFQVYGTRSKKYLAQPKKLHSSLEKCSLSEK